jgi:hypothetical protein
VALGDTASAPGVAKGGGQDTKIMSDEDALQARLDALRHG